MEDDTARKFNCADPGCHQLVVVCRPCDHGNRYCSQVCSARGRRKSLQRAGKRYQQTANGRIHHAARQSAYERRLSEKLTHQCSPPGGVSVTLGPASISNSGQPALKLQINEAGKLRCCRCRTWCGPLLRRHFWQRGRRRVQKQGGKT